MNTIEELIQKECPEGVEFKTLGEVCEIKTGKGITKKDALEGGIYPIISGGIGPMGFFKSKNRDANTVTISRVGANAGFVNLIKEDFYLNDKCFSVIPIGKNKSLISIEFLYYFLKLKQGIIVGLQSEGGVPTINTQKVSKIEIPVPPLSVQHKIVEILDKFTSLEAELEAELEARKKQYEYYRNQLLDFTGREDVEWKTLGEVCEIAIGEFVHKNLQNDAYPYPVYNGGTSNTGFYKEYNREAHNVIISARGANAGYVNKIETRYWAGNSCYSIWSKNDLILSFYFLFYVLKYNEKNLIKSQEKGGGIPAISKKQIQLFEIPVPPLPVQHKIVELLDKFTSLEEELKKELKARKKQYEYYRDKLLSFKRKD